MTTGRRSAERTSLVSRDPEALLRLLAPAGVSALAPRNGEPGLAEATLVRVGEDCAFSIRFERSIIIEQAVERRAAYLTAAGGLSLELTPPSRTFAIEGSGILYAQPELARLGLRGGTVVQGLCVSRQRLADHLEQWFSGRGADTLVDGVTRYGRLPAGPINRFLSFMMREAALETSGVDSPMGLDRQITALLDLMVEQAEGLSPDEAEWNVAPRHLKRAEDYVLANLAGEIALADVARVAGVSARSLHRAFQDFRGMRFGQFVRDARLDAACNLVRDEPGMSLKAAAARVGYADYTSFWRHYRARFGVSPSEDLAMAA